MVAGMDYYRGKVLPAFETLSALLPTSPLLGLFQDRSRGAQEIRREPKADKVITREEVMRRCKNEDGRMVYKLPRGVGILQLSDDTVVKFALGISEQEASTQAYAFHNVDRNVLRVPRVFDFFTEPNPKNLLVTGYIVMELIVGQTIDHILDAEVPVVSQKVATAMNHLASIPAPPDTRPGPVPTGEPCGYMWSDYGAGRSFTSSLEMEDWLNRQLALSRPKERISIASLPLSMRHMDICRRNIILCPDGRVCFVDWQFAGFYPQSFEFVHLKTCQPNDPLFYDTLLELLPELVAEETKPSYLQLGMIMANNIRYGPRLPHRAPPPLPPVEKKAVC